MIKRNSSDSDEQLNALEAHLAGTLKPVTLPNEVLQRLRDRLRFHSPKKLLCALATGSVSSWLLVA